MNYPTKFWLYRFLLLLVVGILLLAVLWSRENVDSGRLTSGEEGRLPRLVTQNNNLIRDDTNEKVILKGITTMAFARYDYDINELMRVLKETKEWQINVVGLYINPSLVDSKLGDIDEIVEWGEDNNIYIYLMPWLSVDQNSTDTLRDKINEFEEISVMFAERYLDKSHILYGLWAEPRRVLWEEWSDVASEMITSIREVNNSATILMTGVSFGRNFYPEYQLLDYENIIFDVHSYPWADENAAGDRTEDEQTLYPWRKLVGEYPVLIGEFGGVYKSDFSGDTDLWYIQQVLDDVEKYQLSYTAYAIDEEGGLGLIDWETLEPTAKGKVIIEDIENYPPTRFD